MSIGRDEFDIEDELQDALSGILDARTRNLVAAWAVAWEQVAPALEAALTELAAAQQGGRLTATMVRRSQRLQSALEAVADSLSLLGGQAATGIIADLQAAAQAAATGQHALIASQLPTAAQAATAGVAVSVSQANPEQVAAMVRRATQRITRDMDTMPRELAGIIRSDLMRGIAVGDNPRATARRMVRRVEDRWDYSLSRAMVASRTETLDAHREAGRVVEEANSDVLAGWTWVAHIDDRTCRSCISMHGTEFPTETPGPDDHHQGRCARVPRTKSWEELGLTNIPEPPPLPIDPEREFRRLPTSSQREILTPAGYEAWQQGDYPMSEWTRRKSNDGWRDSRVPTRPPRAA